MSTPTKEAVTLVNPVREETTQPISVVGLFGVEVP